MSHSGGSMQASTQVEQCYQQLSRFQSDKLTSTACASEKLSSSVGCLTGAHYVASWGVEMPSTWSRPSRATMARHGTAVKCWLLFRIAMPSTLALPSSSPKPITRFTGILYHDIPTGIVYRYSIPAVYQVAYHTGIIYWWYIIPASAGILLVYYN